MKRNRITYHIGLGHDYNPATIDSAQAYLASVFGGYTWLSGSGGWLGPERLEIEPTAYVIVYSTGTNDYAAQVAEWLRLHFAQAEVWYTVEPVTIQVASA